MFPHLQILLLLRQTQTVREPPKQQYLLQILNCYIDSCFLLFTFFLRNIRLRKKIGTILSSRYWEYFIIFLILIYCLLVFANFSLDDSNVSDVSDLRRFILFLTYVELAILFFFAMEILGNIYVYSFKVIQTK